MTQERLLYKSRFLKKTPVESDMLNKLVDLLKNPQKPGVFDEIRQLTTEFDVNSLETVVYHLFSKVDEYPRGRKH